MLGCWELLSTALWAGQLKLITSLHGARDPVRTNSVWNGAEVTGPSGSTGS